jgi:outer membrane protein assembly factor BamD (BamD/ComL family)
VLASSAAPEQTVEVASGDERFKVLKRCATEEPALPEVQAKLREARDRLSESDYLVGYFYFRQRWYPGAIDRFKALLTSDPGYTSRDAVYFYLAEALVRVKREAEALPYLEKLVQEFESSEYLAEAQKRIGELKAQTAIKPSGA